MRSKTQPPKLPLFPSRPALEEDSIMSNANQDGTMKLKLFLAWGFVGIPLIWGVLQTLTNAMKLFH